MKMKVNLSLTILFFAAMLFLTFFARPIHNASIPHVTAERLSRELLPFEYTLEDGTVATGAHEQLAIAQSLLDSGVYVTCSAEKNGEKRNFARLVQVETGRESDGYYEVISGLDYSDRVVITSSGELYDGCEVYVLDN